jgi:acyl carrier protein
VRVQDRLRSFLIDDLGCGMSNKSLTDTYALIDHKVVDSVGIYQLVAFIEVEFDVEILDEELVVTNFATIDDIARLIASKRGS